MTNETALTLDATPRMSPHLEIRSAGSEQLVQNSATGQIHILNALAGLVLGRCDGATTLGCIVDDIVTTNNVDRPRAAQDVLSVCADFRSKALII